MVALKNVPVADLMAAADDNFVTHAAWVQQRTPGMRADVQRDLVLVDSGLPCDTFTSCVGLG